MLLKEMFSPVGGPKEDDQDIDWIDDLKFFMDHSDQILNNYVFPAVRIHEKHLGHPDVYKVYLRILKPCIKEYCKTFNVDNTEDKFSTDKLVDLAKSIAKEQEGYIKKGDYKNS